MKSIRKEKGKQHHYPSQVKSHGLKMYKKGKRKSTPLTAPTARHTSHASWMQFLWTHFWDRGTTHCAYHNEAQEDYRYEIILHDSLLANMLLGAEAVRKGSYITCRCGKYVAIESSFNAHVNSSAPGFHGRVNDHWGCNPYILYCVDFLLLSW